MSTSYRRRKKKRDRSRAERAPIQVAPDEPAVERAPRRKLTRPEIIRLSIAASALLAAFVWSYWPTLVELVGAWNRQPDYSHGYLVLPLALLFLWVRRSKFPGLTGELAWPGLSLVLASLAVRYVGALAYLGGVDGWSIVLWAAGSVWFLGGWRMFLWGLPSVLFLWFMVPLPYRAETILSMPLQRVATTVSCWSLQILGQPALAEGNTILMGENRLEVAQACSGLRIFMGIIALAFAYVVLVRRVWWEKLVILASVVPVAIIANSSRIVATGLLYQFSETSWGQSWFPTIESAKHFAHDASGFVMIPFAAALLGLVLWYMSLLFRKVESVGVGAIVRHEYE